ncbi:twin-arginine translocation pathway signal [Mycolicibacterium goodii]|uniref:twin-arginine translocation pathway signal n=1 Tax=Mycolicibacterium goodii TaxID=134601 RepID=UPI000C266D8D|nr:twin-arginine translocation pathway signal [Mycolicibacterium goodii]PJK19705.1 twin-arginine translocation pathway signal [Mycolicibacterium goodii]
MSAENDTTETGISETGPDIETSVDETDRDAVAGPDEPAGAEDPAPRRGVLHAVRVRAVPILLGLALVASAALATVVYLTQYRVDKQTDSAAADVALKAATDGTVALLSYAPESLDRDFETAKTHLTGDFLSYYTDFTTKVVAPAAQQKKVKTKASVVNGAVSEITPNSAVVLLFINQATTSQEIPDGSFATSSVKVGLTKIDGNWLISTFDPV